MTDDVLRIFMVTGNPDDAALATLVLRHAHQDAVLLQAAQALEFADHLAGGEFSVAIVDDGIAWAPAVDVIEAIKRRYPRCATVLFSPTEQDVASLLVVDAVAHKSSAGFVDLPGAVQRAQDHVFAQHQEQAGAGAYDRLVGQLPLGIFTMNSLGAVSEANQRTLEVLGYKEKQALIGKQLPDLVSDVELRLRFRALLERGQAYKDIEAQIRRGDGGLARVSLSFWPVPQGVHRQPAFEGVLWDVSSVGLAANSQHTGFNLDQLASAVSHDLQDPLQLISQYTRLLKERHAEVMDGDALRLISRVTESAVRMQSMIDGILEFSKIVPSARPFQVVDVNTAVDEALSNLAVSIEANAAHIQRGELPSVVGEPRQIVQLFQNLIGNAIKFHGNASPVVDISGEEREDDWLLSIRDNGIGLDTKKSQRIFDMFQRLHASDEFPGRGLGLAICKRIAQCHGGRIWVESRPGDGSTFFVTIAKNIPNHGLDDRKAG